MKKVIGLLGMVLMVLTIFVGCSSPEENSKENPKENSETKLEADKSAVKVDMKDMDALYEFVKNEIIDITRENFDTWEVYYFDITGDGTDEVVFVSTYGVDWYEKMEIISGDSGEYKRIKSDIPLAKYKNVPAFEDGFLTVKSTTGGTGEQFTVLDLYIYKDTEMVRVLEGLDIMHRVSFPQADFEENAKIDGKLTKFVYTLTKYDNLTEKETIEKKAEYTYNAKTMSFDVKTIKTQKANENKDSNSQASEGELLEIYEAKKEYKLDLNLTKNLDAFSVKQADYGLYLLVNGKRYDFMDLNSEFISEKYKIVKHSEESDYVFVVSAVDPTEGSNKFYFYLYAPNYALERIGFITINLDIEDLDIKNVSYSEVKIGNESYSLEQ